MPINLRDNYRLLKSWFHNADDKPIRDIVLIELVYPSNVTNRG